jgi:hypothetical protein
MRVLGRNGLREDLGSVASLIITAMSIQSKIKDKRASITRHQTKFLRTYPQSFPQANQKDCGGQNYSLPPKIGLRSGLLHRVSKTRVIAAVLSAQGISVYKQNMSE